MRDLQAWWKSEEWRGVVEPWITRALDDAGIRMTGPIDQARVRFWSTQLTIPTSVGRVWFKENNPTQRFEAGLLAELAALVPGRALQPLAIEPRRGWLLTVEQGATLQETPGTDERHWARLLAEFATFQRALAAHHQRLASAGLPDFTPRQAIEYVDERAREFAGTDADLLTATRVALPRLAETAARLESGPIPLSLDHNDLHSNNVFAGAGLDSPVPLRFFDFGDAVWAHPFTSLHVPLGVLRQQWQADLDDSRVAYAVDAYLDAWSDLADRTTLRSILDDALVFGAANRLFTWHRVLTYADEGGLAQFGDAPRYSLAELVR